MVKLQKELKLIIQLSQDNLSREEIELSLKMKIELFKLKVLILKYQILRKKLKNIFHLSKRQDKPDSALWLIRQHNMLKRLSNCKVSWVTKNSVTSIRNKSYWNYNNLNPKDPVALNLFSQKDLVEALEKAERRIKREKKEKEKAKQSKEISNNE